jgi:hypothetical protein
VAHPPWVQTSPAQTQQQDIRDVKDFIDATHTRLQYTPPNIYCTNPAKWAIQTWKNHVLTGMVGLPKSFPIAKWCRLTTQSDITLNIICPCCQNPLLSACKALHGLLFFNATPMAPVGTEVFVHMKPERQCTWEYHASKA